MKARKDLTKDKKTSGRITLLNNIKTDLNK